MRSEEHTSELQSLRHLVCRLLLEKKKRERVENTSTRNLPLFRHLGLGVRDRSASAARGEAGEVVTANTRPLRPRRGTAPAGPARGCPGPTGPSNAATI